MAIDNLPAAMAREASFHFSETLVQEIIPTLITKQSVEVIERATILKNGELTPHFLYLYDYLNSSK